MPEGNGSGVGLTVRDLVLEVRRDVKSIEARVKNLEESKFILRGVWSSITVGAVLVAGTASMILNIISHVNH